MKLFSKKPEKTQNESKGDIKSSFKTKAFRMGGYSVLITAIVLAVIIVLNIAVGALPSSIRQIDVSSNEIFSISDQTKTLVSALDEDVTLYYVAENGKEQSIITGLLEKYSELSKKITVKNIDPTVDPSFASKYSDGDITSNSVVVESEKRYRVVDYSEIIETQTDYSNYASTGQASTTYSFAGEGAITGAIDYVTSESLPKAYAVTGHGETGFSDTFKSYFGMDNIELADLSLVSSDIPEDAATLIINAPTSDITEQEADKLIKYMENGGRLMLITGYAISNDNSGFINLKNLMTVTETYGLSQENGIVAEGDSAHYYQSPYYVIPEIDSHEITDPLVSNNSMLLAPAAQGIKIADNIRSSVKVTKLVETTDSSYAKTNLESTTYEKESGDIDGPFVLAAAAEEDYNGTNTRMVWISCSGMMNDDVDSLVAGGNSDLLRNALAWLTGREDTISIRAKSLSAQALTVPSGSAYILMAVTIIVIPLIIIALGFVIWLRRRKR